MLDYIEAKQKAVKDNARLAASMLFRTASLISRMVTAKRGTQFDAMDEYSFLWTPKERYEAKVQRMLDGLKVADSD